jgi:hypothetical protein
MLMRQLILDVAFVSAASIPDTGSDRDNYANIYSLGRCHAFGNTGH